MPSFNIPAPVGGWNARDSLSNMPPTDAVSLVNLVPFANSVKTRPGYSAHSSDLGSNVDTLVTYRGTTEKLLCAIGGAIINISAGGAGTSLGTGFTNNRWNTTEFKQRIIFCNGADAVQDWDGTTLTATSLTVGADHVTNGAFASDTSWTKGTGWTIAAGVASCSGAQTTTSLLSQTSAITLIPGVTYTTVYTVSSRSAGAVQIQLGGGTAGTARSANGTYTENVVCGSSQLIALSADADFTGNIDNVTVYVAPASLIYPNTFKGRVYYVCENSQHFYYAAAASYAGAITKYDLGTVAGTGANLAFMASWSRDGGAGMDDLAVFVFEDGTVCVYSGDDPADVNAWALVGVFKIGAPIGRRAAHKVGGDLIILTVDGYVPISVTLQEGQYSEQSAFSFKIDRAAKEFAQIYGSIFGWSSQSWPQGSLWIVNVPISTTQSHQHVRNTTTGSWCKWEGVNATQFAVYNGDLYFGAPDGYVYVMGGSSDNGVFIDYECQQAYSHFGDGGSKKQVTAAMAHTNYNLPKHLDYRIFSDFNSRDLPDVSDPPEAEVSEWDVGEWDVAEWDGSLTGADTARKNITGTGYFLSLVFRFKSRAQTVTWWATQFIIKPAGFL